MSLKRLFELAGVAELPKAVALVKADEESKKKEQKTPEDEENKEKDESTSEPEEMSIEDEEKTNSDSIEISVAANPTSPVPVGGAQQIVEPAVVGTTTLPATPAVATPAVAPPAVATPAVATPAAATPVPVADTTVMTPNQVVKMFFNMRDQVHYYHLQTDSFAEHKALNDFYETILDVADKFLEAFQGVHGRAQGDVSFQLKNYAADVVVADVHNFIMEIKALQGQVKNNTDLVNLLDELLNSCNKTLYLLTLK